MSSIDKLRVLIDGLEVDPPSEWPELTISAIVERDEIQPSVSTESFTFSGDARDKIYQHVQDGNIFEGLPLDVLISSLTDQLTVFTGMLDLTDEYSENDPHPVTGYPQTVSAKIKKLNGIETFRELMSATTADTLTEEGVIGSSDYGDIKYIVSDLRDLPFKVAFATVMIYETIQKIQETISRVSDRIANLAAHTGGGATGAAAAAIYAVAVTVVEVAFIAVMAVQSVNVVTEVIIEVLGIVRKHKCITIREYITKAASYRGFNFSSPVKDLDWSILPSNKSTNTGFLDVGNKSVTVGVPAQGDPGYNLGDMMRIMEQTFNGQFFVSGKDVTFRTLSDPFWRQNTTFTLPDVRLEKKEYNTSEIVANRIISFATDPQDNFTIDNYEGTSIAINTDVGVKRADNLSRITELESVDIPFALANRKDRLNLVEQSLRFVAEAIDSLLDVFGIQSQLVDKIEDRRAVMKVTSPYHSVAKLLKLDGNLLHSKYRSELSAEYVWNEYISERSFVSNANRRQRVIYKNLTIPFRFSNLLEILENTVFQMPDGRFGKLTRCEWVMDQDLAEVDIYIEDRYTTNLKESKTIG